jgi:hypothetical protein
MSGHLLFDTPVSYPDDGTPPYVYSTFSHLATRSVVAAIDDLSGNAQTLTLGASDNIVMEAAQNIQAIVKDGGKFEFHNHVGTSHVMFLSVFHNTATGAVTLNTQGKPLFLDSPVVHMNDLQVNGYFNIEGGVIGNSLSVAKYDSSSDAFCMGYGFRINPKDELELVKYAVYENTIDQTQSSIIKKIAIFGTGSAFSVQEASEANNALLPFNTTNGTNLSHMLNNNSSPCTGTCESHWVYSALNNTLVPSPVNVKVGINTPSPVANLHVAGTAIIDNLSATDIVVVNFTMTSDERLKENIVPLDDVGIDDCLEKINKLRIVRYKYKNQLGEKIGFIAQQVESVAKDIVVVKNVAGLDNCKTLDTNAILAYLVGAVQRLYTKVY